MQQRVETMMCYSCFSLVRCDSGTIAQENFLVFGILFLVVTSIIGIMIILGDPYLSVQKPHAWALLLNIHVFMAFYGWNLSGLTAILRYNEFQLYLHDLKIILKHWLVVALLSFREIVRNNQNRRFACLLNPDLESQVRR